MRAEVNASGGLTSFSSDTRQSEIVALVDSIHAPQMPSQSVLKAFRKPQTRPLGAGQKAPCCARRQRLPWEFQKLR
jgi:hypothetical protein